jgi:hypothetical protein
VRDETEEERRKKRLGLQSPSPAVQQLFGGLNFGATGVASVGRMMR